MLDDRIEYLMMVLNRGKAEMQQASSRRHLIVGNWKMNGLSAGSLELAKAVAEGARDVGPAARLVICPPFTQLAAVAKALEGSKVQLGAQDCHQSPSGAHTGDISADMLVDLDVGFVILGHSERRQHHHETDGLVQAKVKAAEKAGLTPIVCVGETAQQRDEGHTLETLGEQISKSLPKDFSGVVAYEPIWAIGSGRSASVKEIDETISHLHDVIGRHLDVDDKSMSILYGGSVTARDAASILSIPAVGGVLVGGASLSAESFLGIARAALATTA